MRSVMLSVPMPRVFHYLCVFLALLALSPGTTAYSVLTHEQVVDLRWVDQIQPLLLHRFPSATPDDLRKAHAYAYGGSLIQDMGYYPFGSQFFSNLVHYVRSGDFVQALIRDSSDLNEYAFSLGALSHYASDNDGHPTVNRAVAIEFPKLRRKHGNSVTYEDDPKAHIRTEFGFDVVQVAKNRYTSDSYHDMIGFEVSKPLLERAFLETYGLNLEDVFGNVDLAIGSYRRGVSRIIPEMTRVALISRREVIVKDTPNFDKKKFLYYLSRSNYEHEWGTQYRKPGVGARVIAFFLDLVPKIGPFKAVRFEVPTKQTEDMYIKSVDETVVSYSALLQQARAGTVDLPNRDFDTGKDTQAGEYALTDKTYAQLLDELSKKSLTTVTPALRKNLLTFYGNMEAPIATKKNPKDWQKLQDELKQLKGITPAPA